MKKLGREFYSKDTLVVAKELLGKILVHKTEGKTLKAKIVETEAYLGLNDKAAHSYGGKVTNRIKTMYDKPGIAYVYFIWGKHYCLNVITKKEGIPEGVLIRAFEPIENINQIVLYRFNKSIEELNRYEKNNISNGPGKLTKAMNIDIKLNGEDLCKEKLYIETEKDSDFNIIETTRIGIDYAEEAIDYDYRFYIENNSYVSRL
ncbi:MAG: DNA-3-methyladenine glycosylase [Clostridium sp.]|nr:DNA-3-methyladenine glycosylase [Clostridium sp.]